MTRTLASWALAALLSHAAHAAHAAAQEQRLPGLGGEFSTRLLTTPKNSLALIGGPGQTPLFAQRYGGSVIDGGFAYHRRDANALVGSGDNQVWGRIGVAFGLWDNIEAGALFLTFRFAKDFSYSDFPVYITYSWMLGNVDIGARFSFVTPAESGNWALNPGLPVVVRLAHARIDTGAFVPVRFQDTTSVGLTIPARFILNVTPALFFLPPASTGITFYGLMPRAASTRFRWARTASCWAQHFTASWCSAVNGRANPNSTTGSHHRVAQ